MIACVLDPIGCISGALWQWVASVPLYWWAICGLVLVGVVWKLAGWPGIIALVGAAGFILGRRSADHPTEVGNEDPPVRKFGKVRNTPPGKRVRTIFDMFGKKG